MAKEPFVGDRLGARDFFLATSAGLAFFLVYAVLGPRGLDPALWDDMAAAVSLRPPATIVSGVWRFLAFGLYSYVGADNVTTALRFAGAAVGALSVMLVYLVVRQALAYLTRVKSLEYWQWIAPLFAIVATVCFGAGDAMLRVVSPLTPGGLTFLLLLLSLHLFIRAIKAGGVWRVLLAMFLAGAAAADNPVGFLIPALDYLLYRLALEAVVNERLLVDVNAGRLMLLPRWRMFFSFLAGLVLVVGVNIFAFVFFGGFDACGWTGFDIPFRYVVTWYDTVAHAASPIGWVLSATFAVLPLVAALVLFPMLCRDTDPIRFRLGLILLFAGILALIQCGILPYTRLWSFSSGAVELRSDLFECLFMLMTALTLALAGSCFTLGAQTFFAFDGDEGVFYPAGPRGFIMRNLVQAVVIVAILPVVFRIYRPVETELRAIVHDALAETVRECGDVAFLFTDGRLDAGFELIAAQMGSPTKPLNMMTDTSSEWARHMRTRFFEKDTPDCAAAEVGVPVLLRAWAGERTNGMDHAAVQLGFEFWRRARKPLPRQSGLVAREKGLSDADVERGVAAANALAARIVRAAKEHPHVVVSPALRSAVSSVSWRLSRFARMRDDEVVANELDEWNDTVKHLMKLIDYERVRTFMQMTPVEGLRLALRRADFAEARRFGVTVLQIDPEDPEANFGTGMAYLMEDKLKEAEFYLARTLAKRPEEPAVLNNLSIIYRKTNRLEKALEYVKKAHELMPENEEILSTLKETERVIATREATLKSAFGR